MRDFSFRVPKNGHAMRKHVATALDVAALDGVRTVVPDPTQNDVVYVVCDRSTWYDIQARAARLSGCERRGDRRLRLFTTPERENIDNE